MGGRPWREGTWVYLWLILVDVWQKNTKLCKVIILQLKNLKKKTKKYTITAKKKKSRVRYFCRSTYRILSHFFFKKHIINLPEIY